VDITARLLYGLRVLVALGIGAVAVGTPAFASGGGPVPAGALPIPTDTPIVNLANPPLSVAAPSAVDSCANDDFLADRAIPQPWTREVTVCGTVLAAATAGAGFALDVDGTPSIAVMAAGGVNAHPGDTAVVRGRYHRSNSGAEWIDGTQRVVSGNWAQPGYVIINGTTHE
jgi:hypothetical protein